MLYLSLILIASGIFFILYTLFIRAKKEPGISDSIKDTDSINISGSIAMPSINYKSKSRGDHKKDIHSANQKKIINEYNNIDNRINISQDVAAADIKGEKINNDLLEDIEKDVDSIIDDRKKETGLQDNISDIPYVSLYEDSSNIIDYDNKDSIIDSTLSEYKKIKRIGEGNIEILKDGINFRTGKKLFRFDYHRVADVKKGNNFFVLLMKGSNVSRLFVFKESSLLSTKLNQLYNKNSSNCS